MKAPTFKQVPRLMGDKSAIEWTDATWNPTTGCDKVSPGCDNCYALTLAKRLKGMGVAKYQRDGNPRTSGPGFGFTEHPGTLDQPLRWKRPRRIFVNSMSDLFHHDISLAFQTQVFDVMESAPWHTFQILTKRPEIMRRRVTSVYESLGLTRPAPHIWLGTTIENNDYVKRADHLRLVPAVRFLSLEPLLGPLPDLDLGGIDWVIVGGESGRGARPMHPDWARSIRDSCLAEGVAFHFKQWGEHAPAVQVEVGHSTPTGYFGFNGEWSGPNARIWGNPTPVRMARVGKRAAGRLLDGRTWDEWPNV